ncbi:hypothetical protein [Tamlana sp. I1]|uniref:hypothetical protein n=1 Tax=Tamlana sp. I1 TaxID=2762061 RepID=UPI00188E47DF|nr:hypothetical protein [Tamlana sp. I1]
MLFCQSAVEIVADTTTIYSGYSTELEKPIVINGFTFMKNSADVKLYVFNEQSYNHFQELRKFLKENSSFKTHDIIEELNNTIAKNHYLYTNLSKKCKAQQLLFNETTNDFEQHLNTLEQTVNLTQNSLIQANTTLEIATEELKAYRKKQFWKNFGYVGGGVAAGLIMGFLMAN